MTHDPPEPTPRRKTSADTLAGREAARLVRELNRQLGYWQAVSVKLHTMAERVNATGRADASVVEEANALFNVVKGEAKRFESLLPAQPAAVASHGRIDDTRRSFDMVSHRLRASLRLLGADPDSGDPLAPPDES